VVAISLNTHGVGAIVALTFKSAVDDPTRFRRARDVGPWLGLRASAQSTDLSQLKTLWGCLQIKV
jgi:transposase